MSTLEQLLAEVRERPHDLAAWCRLSAGHAKLGNLSAAREAARRAQALNPPHAKDWLALGKIWELADDKRAAMLAYQRASRLDRNNADAHIALGSAMMEQGDARAAALAFRVAVGVAPDSSAAHFSLARSLLAGGAPRDALSHAARAAELAPDARETLLLLADLLELTGDGARAIVVLDRLVSLEPENFDAVVKLARKLIAHGDDVRGRAMLKRALELGPRTPDHYSALGHALMDAGKGEHAIRFFREATQLKPNSAEAHLQLGLALENVGLYEDALNSIRSATQLAPTSAPGYYHLGLLLRKLDDIKGASAALVRAAALAGEDPAIQGALAEVMTARHATPVPRAPARELTTEHGSFTGDLAILHLPETLEFLMHQRATGVLLVTSEHGNGSIEFYEGNVGRTRSPSANDDSGAIHRLIATNPGDKDKIRDLLARQAVPIMKELLRWQSGQVTFRALPPEQMEGDRELTLDPRHLLFEAMRQLDEESR